ncbi:MAG: hypothetical protein RR291_03400, partial [Clostridia bacterium]
SLLNGEKFCVVSTSLIEAGVDLDFQLVFREMAGLDNLLQTAGRCNREGIRQNAVAYAFTFEECEMQPKKDKFAIKQYLCNQIFENYKDVQSYSAVVTYFDKLYSYSKAEMESMDFADKKWSKNSGYNFCSYAEEFKLIDDDRITVVVACLPKAQEILHRAEQGDKASKRALQQYSVSLYQNEFKQLFDIGVINNINGINILTSNNYYKSDTGIQFEDDTVLQY